MRDLLFAFGLPLLGCHGRTQTPEPPPSFVDDPLLAWPHKSPPILRVGTTGQSSLAVVPQARPARLWVYGQPGTEPESLDVTGLSWIHSVLTTERGALAVGHPGFVELDAAGRPTANVVELDLSEEPVQAWALFAGGLAGLSGKPGGDTIHVQRFARDGRSLGSTPITSSRNIRSPVLASLSPDLLAVVWVSSGLPSDIVAPGETPLEVLTVEQENALSKPELVLALLDAEGTLASEPRGIYKPGLGGTLLDCTVQSRPAGGALLAWGDSTPGRWSVYAMVIEASGDPRKPARVNGGERRDALDIALPAGGEGRWISWGTGIHWGMFERSGTGRVALRHLVPGEPPRIFEGRGSVESHGVAISAQGVLVVTGVLEGEDYDVRGEHFPPLP